MYRVILEPGQVLDSSKHLCVYVITYDTEDFPGVYTVRQQWTGPDLIYFAYDPLGHGNTLEEARQFIPQGLTRFLRNDVDDPVIVESWL